MVAKKKLAIVIVVFLLLIIPSVFAANYLVPNNKIITTEGAKCSGYIMPGSKSSVLLQPTITNATLSFLPFNTDQPTDFTDWDEYGVCDQCFKCEPAGTEEDGTIKHWGTCQPIMLKDEEVDCAAPYPFEFKPCWDETRSCTIIQRLLCDAGKCLHFYKDLEGTPDATNPAKNLCLNNQCGNVCPFSFDNDYIGEKVYFGTEINWFSEDKHKWNPSDYCLGVLSQCKVTKPQPTPNFMLKSVLEGPIVPMKGVTLWINGGGGVSLLTTDVGPGKWTTTAPTSFTRQTVTNEYSARCVSGEVPNYATAPTEDWILDYTWPTSCEGDTCAMECRYDQKVNDAGVNSGWYTNKFKCQRPFGINGPGKCSWDYMFGLFRTASFQYDSNAGYVSEICTQCNACTSTNTVLDSQMTRTKGGRDRGIKSECKWPINFFEPPNGVWGYQNKDSYFKVNTNICWHLSGNQNNFCTQGWRVCINGVPSNTLYLNEYPGIGDLYTVTFFTDINNVQRWFRSPGYPVTDQIVSCANDPACNPAGGGGGGPGGDFCGNGVLGLFEQCEIGVPCPNLGDVCDARCLCVPANAKCGDGVKNPPPPTPWPEQCDAGYLAFPPTGFVQAQCAANQACNFSCTCIDNYCGDHVIQTFANKNIKAGRTDEQCEFNLAGAPFGCPQGSGCSNVTCTCTPVPIYQPYILLENKFVSPYSSPQLMANLYGYSWDMNAGLTNGQIMSVDSFDTGVASWTAEPNVGLGDSISSSTDHKPINKTGSYRGMTFDKSAMIATSDNASYARNLIARNKFIALWIKGTVNSQFKIDVGSISTGWQNTTQDWADEHAFVMFGITNLTSAQKITISARSTDASPAYIWVDDLKTISYLDFRILEQNTSVINCSVAGQLILCGSPNPNGGYSDIKIEAKNSLNGVSNSTMRVTVQKCPSSNFNITLSPASPNVLSTLTCAMNPTFNNLALRLTYNWYENGALFKSVTKSDQTTNRQDTVDLTQYSSIKKHDNVNCTVLVTSFGGDQICAQKSAVRTVQNICPTMSAVSLTKPAYTNTVLIAASTGWNDADGDLPQYAYYWYKNGIFVSSVTDALQQTFPAAKVRGDNITVVAAPYDGECSGANVSDSVLILNSLPIVNLTNDGPKTGCVANFNLNALATDADGDSLQYRFDYESDGTFDTVWGASSTASHTYSAGGEEFKQFIATVEVTDGINTTVSQSHVIIYCNVSLLPCDQAKNLTAELDNNLQAVNLSWGIGSPTNVTGFRICRLSNVVKGTDLSYKSTDFDCEWSPLLSASARTWQDTDAAQYKTKYYKVKTLCNFSGPVATNMTSNTVGKYEIPLFRNQKDGKVELETFSIPLMPTKTYIMHVLKSIGKGRGTGNNVYPYTTCVPGQDFVGNYSSVWQWDALAYLTAGKIEAKGVHFYHSSSLCPYYLSPVYDLKNVTPGKYYELEMKNNDTLINVGEVMLNNLIPLYSGIDVVKKSPFGSTLPHTIAVRTALADLGHGRGTDNQDPIFVQNFPEVCTGNAADNFVGNYTFVKSYDGADRRWETYDPDLPCPFYKLLLPTDITHVVPGEGYLIEMTANDTLSFVH